MPPEIANTRRLVGKNTITTNLELDTTQKLLDHQHTPRIQWQQRLCWSGCSSHLCHYCLKYKTLKETFSVTTGATDVKIHSKCPGVYLT